MATSVSPQSGDRPKLKLTNQLATSMSPYVRAHASNLTAWQMWSPESLALARRENRLIFLSSGYAACHWCHVMERESFQDPQVARILNENFIPIKIDREERPDIDRIYMNYVQATTGSGGWPLNVFLTPDLEPVFGGTYWPGPNATDAPLMKDQIGFVDVLDKTAKVWREQQEKCLTSAKEIVQQLKDFTDEGLKGSAETPSSESTEILEIDLLEEAYQHFCSRYDAVNGGFGGSPKFPTPVNLAFLLRLSCLSSIVEDIVGDKECGTAQLMAVTTLKNMNRGGLHDHIGNGFARYSVTEDWSLPHFEKMLYDNAQLVSVYLDAYLLTRDQELLDGALDAADYLCFGPLSHKDGGFYSSEDADSYARKGDTEKREGAFYVWDRKEFTKILGEQDADICAKYWDVRTDGNVDPKKDIHDEFLHQNVLQISMEPAQIGAKLGHSEATIFEKIKNARQKLRDYRDRERPRPNLDDKILTGWNGLAIAALARLAAALEEADPERSKVYLSFAIRAAQFIRKNVFDPRTLSLRRLWREGPAATQAFADDYAFLIYGLLSLYDATFDAGWLHWAHDLQAAQTKLFWDEAQGGFFSTERDAADLILRLKDGMDSAEPSTNGISAANLYRLGSLLGDGSFSTLASKTCHAFSTELMQHPFLFPSMLPSVVASNLGTRLVMLAGKKSDPAIRAIKAKLRSKLLTNTSVLFMDPTEKGENSTWLLGKNESLREAIKGAETKPLVQVCGGQRCIVVQNVEELEKAFADLGIQLLETVYPAFSFNLQPAKMSVTNDAGNFFQSNQALDKASRRARKKVELGDRGRPIKVPTKILAILPDPRSSAHVFIAEAGNTARRVNVQDPTEPYKIYRGHTAPVTALALNSDASILYTGSWDKTLLAFSTASRGVLSTFVGHGDFIKSLVFTDIIPGKPLLISCSSDATVIIWDPATGDKLHRLTSHPLAVQTVVVDPAESTPDALVFYSAGSGREIKKWVITVNMIGVTDVHEVAEIRQHETGVIRLRFLGAPGEEPDLWSTSADKTVKRLERSTLAGLSTNGPPEADTVLEHTDFVNDVAIDSSGKWILTASSDEDIRIWDAATGELYHRLLGHHDVVVSLAVIGTDLISVALDTTVRKWSLKPEDIEAVIELDRRLAAGETDEEDKKAEKSKTALTAEEEQELADLMAED
ncbi:hypothetical protein Dda_2988 [Drechslerella dactyloides]|uniref:Spermatogenesis-associated protein 20-like TRX domain-containing protein n=1 Tax=Drechslerella dactyloides TaxID=74499 RepID=A0AAD6J0H7_DREDA|nr:hypothetical protein Dda_2988 [Drechslerella dactyloides]